MVGIVVGREKDASGLHCQYGKTTNRLMSEEAIKAKMRALDGTSDAKPSEPKDKVRLQVYVQRSILKKLRHMIADEGGNLSSAVEAMLLRELSKRP